MWFLFLYSLFQLFYFLGWHLCEIGSFTSRLKVVWELFEGLVYGSHICLACSIRPWEMLQVIRHPAALQMSHTDRCTLVYGPSGCTSYCQSDLSDMFLGLSFWGLNELTMFGCAFSFFFFFFNNAITYRHLIHMLIHYTSAVWNNQRVNLLCSFVFTCVGFSQGCF